MTLREISEIAFRAAGHAFVEANDDPEMGMAWIDCLRCRQGFTYDTDTRHVVGGGDPLRMVDSVCSGKRVFG